MFVLYIYICTLQNILHLICENNCIEIKHKAGILQCHSAPSLLASPSWPCGKLWWEKNRVIDIPQRSYMVLPRVAKKRKKEKKTWNGLLNVSNGHKHINHPGLLLKSRKTTPEAERRKVQMKKSNSIADVSWIHTTDRSSTGKLASIIKRANRPAPMQHTLTFCTFSSDWDAH